MEKTDKIWMDGEFVDWDNANIHILTHALHYGTAIFEGIRCYKTEKGPAVFRLSEHIDRLFGGMRVFCMKISYSKEEICNAICELIRMNKLDACYIRPIAYVSFKEMGLFPLNNPVKFTIAVWPWGTYLGEEGIKNGIRCKISSWVRPDSRILPPTIKCSANYANSVLAKIEALDCGYNEAIQLNIQGLVAEGPGENIFMVKNGKLFTPPTSSSALCGITAQSVIEIGKDLEISFERRDILREELLCADELFFTGTAAEITPIREIDGRIIGNGKRGPITEKIQTIFFDIVSGKLPKYDKWLTLV
ncbi:TPA: branched chain amino acid aminotransferase [bacterium]|nr:branched chain amino acid aminotransferase [bacterium]